MAPRARILPVVGVISLALAAAIILVCVGRLNLPQSSVLKERKAASWSSEMGTDSVFLPKFSPVSADHMTFHALKSTFVRPRGNGPFDDLKARFQILEELLRHCKH